MKIDFLKKENLIIQQRQELDQLIAQYAQIPLPKSSNEPMLVHISPAMEQDDRYPYLVSRLKQRSNQGS